MANALRILPVVALALSATGCLQIETSHTLYLSPDGAVSWMVEEKGVYSDEKNPASRDAEEDGYIVAARGGTQRMALALADLGPTRPVRTHILRDERPYHVVTEASFDDIERVMQRLFYESGVQTRVTLERYAGESTLRLAFDFSQQAEGRETAASALLESLEGYRFVLTDGEFASSSGFEITGSRVATFAKEWLTQSEKEYEAGGTTELVLTWKR